MKHYNYTMLLRHDGEVDAVIFTNVKPEIIEEAVQTAHDKWQELGTVPESQLDFTLEYLSELYELDFTIINIFEIDY